MALMDCMLGKDTVSGVHGRLDPMGIADQDWGGRVGCL